MTLRHSSRPWRSSEQVPSLDTFCSASASFQRLIFIRLQLLGLEISFPNQRNQLLHIILSDLTTPFWCQIAGATSSYVLAAILRGLCTCQIILHVSMSIQHAVSGVQRSEI